MSAHVIPFPKKHDPTKTIESEEEMVAWSVWMRCVESKRYSLEEAEDFGKSLWRIFHDRAAASHAVAKRAELERTIHGAVCGWLFFDDAGAVAHIRNFLRVRYHVNSTDDIPDSSLDEAIAIVQSMKLAAWDFLGAMNDLRAAFKRQVFGGNEPWTPAVRRKLKRAVGDRPDWRTLAAELEQHVH